MGAGQLVVMSGVPVPHAGWCARSEATIARLAEACRPPGASWTADCSDETLGRLRDYLADLDMAMLQPPAAESGDHPL